MSMINSLQKEIMPIHETVLLEETIDYISPKPKGIYVDATIGLGGHSELILRYSDYNSTIIGFDLDEDALTQVKKRFWNHEERIHLKNINFFNIDNALDDMGIYEVDGIIADLGISSFQLEQSGKGFSFMKDEFLDMRMDITLQFKASDLVNEMTEEEISTILFKFGEERWAKKISKRIIEERANQPIYSSQVLANIVSDAIPRKFHPKRIHPATRTFQALRIAVNSELENLKTFIDKAIECLRPGARIAIISFHSLEDRIVKQKFSKLSSDCICPPGLPVCGCNHRSKLKIITRSPVTPSKEEIVKNPRSRSAKLRVAEKK